MRLEKDWWSLWKCSLRPSAWRVAVPAALSLSRRVEDLRSHCQNIKCNSRNVFCSAVSLMPIHGIDGAEYSRRICQKQGGYSEACGNVVGRTWCRFLTAVSFFRIPRFNASAVSWSRDRKRTQALFQLLHSKAHVLHNEAYASNFGQTDLCLLISTSVAICCSLKMTQYS